MKEQKEPAPPPEKKVEEEAKAPQPMAPTKIIKKKKQAEEPAASIEHPTDNPPQKQEESFPMKPALHASRPQKAPINVFEAKQPEPKAQDDEYGEDFEAEEVIASIKKRKPGCTEL